MIETQLKSNFKGKTIQNISLKFMGFHKLVFKRNYFSRKLCKIWTKAVYALGFLDVMWIILQGVLR